MSTQQRMPIATTYGDETIPDHWLMEYEEGLGGAVINAEVMQNERTVHTQFFNDFDDLFNDEDLD